MQSAKIYVTLKNGVLDPQGKAIQQALESLGFSDLNEVRVGKFFEIELKNVKDPAQAKAQLTEMAQKLLANPVIENYRIEIEN